MKKEFLLYITINKLNGKVYGGKHIGRRTDNYIGSGPSRFLHAVREHGRENFERRWLNIKITSEDKLNKLERRLIRLLKHKFGDNCYNVHIGGSGGYLLQYCSKEFRDEVSRRISEGKKKQYASGLTVYQVIGRTNQTKTLKTRHLNDQEFREKMLIRQKKKRKNIIKKNQRAWSL